MKRILLIMAAVAAGMALVWSLTYFGDRGKGPLEDLLTMTGAKVSEIEREFIVNRRSSIRKDALQWLDTFQTAASLRSFPDTLFLGIYDNTTEESLYPIVQLEEQLDLEFPLIHIYSAWGSKEEQQFPGRLVRSIHNLGSIPFITWEPWLTDFDRSSIYRGDEPDKNGLGAISNGDYDFYLEDWVREANKHPHPMFVRLGHEMNDPYRYPWGPQNNPPEMFIAAWRHIVEFFRERGADHILWVWSPHPAYPPYDPYYPGDDWVDWVGSGALNYGTAASWSRWWSFKDIFGKYYPEFEKYGKPVVITEFSTLAVGGDREEWYARAMEGIHRHYPAVRGLMLFNHHADHSTTYKSLDWSIEGDSVLMERLRGLLKGEFEFSSRDSVGFGD